MPMQSTITVKGQTTLPSGVRAALDVGPGDRVAYTIEGDHAVLTKARPLVESDARDPVVDAFLAFLERDMQNHPERLRELPQSLLDRMDAILGDDDVDLDEELVGDVAL